MQGTWLGGGLAIASAIAVLLVVELQLRREPAVDLRPRLSRPVFPASQRRIGLRAFRWWGWAGAVLLLVGGILLVAVPDIAATPFLMLAEAIIASGLLAWSLGLGIGVVRAFDPPEHGERQRAGDDRPSRRPGGVR